MEKATIGSTEAVRLTCGGGDQRSYR